MLFKKKTEPLMKLEDPCEFLGSKTFQKKARKNKKQKGEQNEEANFIREYRNKSLLELSQFILKPCIYKRR